VAPSWWNENSSAWVKLAIAAVALAMVGWAEWAKRAHSPDKDRQGSRWRPRLLAALGVLGFLAYFNFGSFHFGGIFVHLWDSAHYVLGARYFDELGYDGLYECIAVADAETPGAAPRVAKRPIIDLRTNRLTTAAEVVAHPERCMQRFSPQRWAAFAADVAFFRSEFPDADWERLPTDHGFNASPAWLLLAHPLAGSGPLTWWRLKLLAALDPLLVLGSLGAVAGAFGGWTAALVAIVFGTYFPGRLWWTGGSFLRWDWLAALLIGLALCRRSRPFAGGVLLGYAALLRVFPVFALVGVVLAAIVARLRHRPFDPAAGRMLLGALAVTLVLGPLSGAVRRDHAWLDFARNLQKHTSVASGNRMGLTATLAFDAQARRQALLAGDGEDTRSRWERAQAETLRRRQWLWVGLAVLGTLAVAAGLRDQPAWVAAVLGLLLIPLGTALACYYYVFVAALALLAERRSEVGGITLALTIAAAVVARLSHYEMDEQYAAQSLLMLLGFAFIASAFLPRQARAPIG
jgi:hypothetical protein